MVGVFRGRPGSRKRCAPVAVLCLLITGCGSGSTSPETTLPPGVPVPDSLDGFWLLAGSELTIDIDLDTAAVDGRTSCARLLGSLTFEDSGARTSFSLPGRDDSRCSNAERVAVERIVELLEAVQSATPEPGAYRLLDAGGTSLGRLESGG